MPAPQIEQPLAGDDFVIVRSAVPGARIRVRASGDEIGDGGGNPIALGREVWSGEIMTVSQHLGECDSIQALVITVQ